MVIDTVADRFNNRMATLSGTGKQNASVTPYLPPGGIPLMQGPLTTVTTTEEKQQHYLLAEVEEKLADLRKEEDYETTKILLFVWCVLSGIGGAFLVLYAMGLTVLFASTKPSGIKAWSVFSVGLCLMLPCLVWFKYVYLPTAEQKEFRRFMHAKRRERIDEQARVVKETLRLAKIEDAKKEAAKQRMLNDELQDDDRRRSSTNRKSFGK